MKKFITFIILFKLVTIITCLDPPRCGYGSIYSSHTDIEPMGEYVDWWIYEHFNKGGAFYTDSNLKTKEKKVLELPDFNMRDKTTSSPITNTYDQIKNSDFSSIAYNDNYGKSLGGSQDSGGSAHAKGFFIWNEAGGIHVIHSIPETPQKSDHFFLDTSTDLYMQHSICITLKKEELDVIPKYLIYTNPMISLMNTKIFGPKSLSKINSDSLSKFNAININKNTVPINNISTIKTFTEMDTIIEDNFITNSILPKEIKILQWAQLALHIKGNLEFTSDNSFKSMHYYKSNINTFGEYFVQTAIESINSRIISTRNVNFAPMNNIEIIWQYIGKQYSDFSKWISQTMTSDNGFPKIDNIYSITYRLNYPFLNTKPKRSASKDHSKLMYGISDDGSQKILCLGDLNWQFVQDSRGGGAFCMKDVGYLVDYMKRHVSWMRKGIKDSELKIGIPHSTVGTIIDFSWISEQLSKEKLSEPMGFEILVSPNSLHPLSERLIEREESNFITDKAPLLISSDQNNNYWVEEISIDIFHSIADKVFVCKQLECTYESTIKSNIVSKLKLEVESSKDLNLQFKTPSLIISVDSLTKSYYFSSRLADKIFSYAKVPNGKIYLIETEKTLNDFQFDFSVIPYKTNCGFIKKDDTFSFEFHPKCIDQLTFCLYQYFKVVINPEIGTTLLDGYYDQTTFYNGITDVLKKIIPTVPDNIDRCVAPKPPGSSDPSTTTDTNNIMRTSSMNDLDDSD
ncbi:hypothetical protein RB653_009549 [Dictyostelium firmibasis]|uniref:DNase I-like protein n=1 Tax=Dictyostelium firmibasis TaxID=79012 RepID=A0AAN7YVI2_9MYCE